MATDATEFFESAEFEASPENLMIQGLFYLGDVCSVISNRSKMQDIADDFYDSALSIYSAAGNQI